MGESRAAALDVSDPRWAIYDQILSRTGIVEDPFRREATTMFLRKAVQLVRESLGEEGRQLLLDRILDRHFAPNPETRRRFLDLLRDEYGWVNGYLLFAGILHASILTGRTDLHRQVAFLSIADRASAHATLGASVMGLSWIYRHIAEINHNFNQAIELRYEKAGSCKALIHKRRVKWYKTSAEARYDKLTHMVTRLDCEMLDSCLAAVPLLFGLPAAAVTHLRCEKDGAEECDVLVEWQEVGFARRFLFSFRNLSPAHRALLARIGQFEVLIRDRTARLEEAHARAMAQARELTSAEAQVRMGKAYAASAAHDINNALGPARSGIEQILNVLRSARPLTPPLENTGETAETDVARQLGGLVEERLGRVIAATEKAAPHLSREELASLLDSLELFASLAATMRVAIPDIYRGINRASDFTAFMTELARVDHAEQREPVALDALLEGLVAKYRKLWEHSGVALESSIEPGLTVLGWARVFESIFSNLLDNAAKAVHGRERRVVRIEARRAGKECAATISDSGPGVPQDLTEKIFEFGFTTRPAQGKGFGLAYARNYALLLGGDVAVENLPGGGAAFRVRLPLA